MLTLEYCRPNYFSKLTILAIVATGRKIFKLNAIFSIALYAIYKLEGNR